MTGDENKRSTQTFKSTDTDYDRIRCDRRMNIGLILDYRYFKMNC